MEFQTKIILISLAFSFIMGLITIPILKKLKERILKENMHLTFRKIRREQRKNESETAGTVQSNYNTMS